MKVLGSSVVAPYNRDTMKVLEDNHLCMPPPSMLTTLLFEVLLVAYVGIILNYIKSFSKWTLCDRFGSRSIEGLVVAIDLLCEITLVVNIWVRGRCLMSL